MRENRVRAWVEVSSCSSVMKIFIAEFNEIPPCVKCDESKAAVRGRKEVVGPAVYKILQSSMKNSYRSHWRGLHSGQTNHEAKSRRVGSSPWGGQISPLPNRGAVGESHISGRRGKTPWRKLVSAINTVRKSQAASPWGPCTFRPSTAYGTFQPHTRVQKRVPGQSVGKSCAVPGRHNSVGQCAPGGFNCYYYKKICFCITT